MEKESNSSWSGASLGLSNSGLLEWTRGAANGATSFLFINDVTDEGGSRWIGRCTHLNSHKSSKKDEAPQWGRINQNGAPDLKLNRGFLSDTDASSGCPDVTAILPVCWDSLSRQFYPGCFELHSGESQTCPDWMWTKTRGRSKADARQDRQIKRPCLNKSKMQSRLLNHLLQRGLSWKHRQAQHKPHAECNLNQSLRMESSRRAVTVKTLTGGKKPT